jgi:hypothetical protein
MRNDTVQQIHLAASVVSHILNAAGGAAAAAAGSLIGAGSFGRVFLGCVDGREVAIKVVHHDSRSAPQVASEVRGAAAAAAAGSFGSYTRQCFVDSRMVWCAACTILVCARQHHRTRQHANSCFCATLHGEAMLSLNPLPVNEQTVGHTSG